MAELHQTTQETNVDAAGEHNDRGILDFLEKKEEENKPQEELSVPAFAEEHVHKAEEKKEEEVHNHPLAGSIEQVPRSNSSSSPSDEEESEEGKKKKGIKDQIQEKITGNKEEHEKDNGVKQVDGEVETEEKKGILEKVKEKLPHKKTEVDPAPAPLSVPVQAELEKKGLMEKIKEKLPGHHQTEDEKEIAY